MKKIFKFLWCYLEIDLFLLTEEEAIIRYCDQNPALHKDNCRPYKHFYSLVHDGEMAGYVANKFGEWIFVAGDLIEIHGTITKITSLRQLKKLVKKYTT